MRLTELAKELNTSPRDLFSQAQGLGIEVYTYIERLDSDAADALRNGFVKRSSVEVADDEYAMRNRLKMKRELAAETAEKAVRANAEALQTAIERAKQIEQNTLALRGQATTPPSVEPMAAERTVGKQDPVEPLAVEALSEAASIERVASVEIPITVEAPPVEAPPVEAPPVEAPPVEMPSVEAPRVPVTVAVTAPETRPETAAAGGLKQLPQRQMQAPRPEVAIQQVPVAPKVEPPPASVPAASSAKKDKRPRGIHPVDDVDETDVLPRSLSKAVKDDPPSRVLPTRRGKEHDTLRDPREQRRVKGADDHLADPISDVAAKILRLHGAISVKELAERLGTRPNVVIAQLMKVGILASINQSVDSETAARIAAIRGFTVEQEKSKRSSENRPIAKNPEADDDIPEDRPDQLVPRAPVVTFLGHVDHGKTSLMDRIRSASVAPGEAGGITQHIAAYTVDVNGQPITFLDTPGHAAFSTMRARGAHLTDIAVIIIAADDGVMPQTKEAIKHARAADVTLMIAINKCDLPQANPLKVMQQLQAENLTPEEWGGDTVVCQVSAVTGDGVGNLLDMILLQAEVLELTANPSRRANGMVVEAEMKPGSGPIASVLVTGGTLEVGDVMLCGEQYGKVRAIIDSAGHRVKSIKPSVAGRVMGLSGVPEAGAEFRVMVSEKRARELAEEYAQLRKEELLGGMTKARSVDDIFKKIHEAGTRTLDIILRADVQGSVEAVTESIMQIISEKVACNIIQASTGAITSNDVQRAANSNALIIGFNVSPESGVTAEARHVDVRVKTFRIIYELLDHVKQEMLELIPVEYREVVRGHAHVRQIFTLNHIGVAAGCVVMDGVIVSSGKARVLRNKKVVHTGGIATIRHFKEEVKEVTAAQECGILLTDYESFEENDVIECFSYEELPKTL